MNILMITPDFPYSFGGIGEHVYNLVTTLQERKDVTIYVMITRFADSKLGIRKNENILADNIFLYEIRSTQHQKYQKLFFEERDQQFAYEFEALKTCSYSLEIFEEIEKIVKKEKIKIDLIHVHDAFGAITAVALKKKYAVPLITTMHSIGNEDFLIDGLRKYLLRNSSKVIFVSSYLQSQLFKRFNLEKENWCVIPNGINLEEKVKGKCKNQLLYVGRLERKKGVDILLKAMKRLKENGLSEIKLEICGEGTERNILEQDILKFGIQEQVKLLGYQSKEVLNLKYEEADLVIVPSREESFGLVAIEAMAQGTCVLCSNIECFYETVGEEAGFFFELEDEKDLAEKIIYALSNQQKREEKVMKGFERIKQEFSWKKIADRTVKVYNSEQIPDRE